MNFEQLRVANHERNTEWNQNDNIELSFRGLELAGEVGKFCNVLKKLERIRLGLAGGKSPKWEDIEDEVADIVISLDLICMDLGLDIGLAVKNKFNKTSEKHGFKTKLGD